MAANADPHKSESHAPGHQGGRAREEGRREAEDGGTVAEESEQRRHGVGLDPSVRLSPIEATEFAVENGIAISPTTALSELVGMWKKYQARSSAPARTATMMVAKGDVSARAPLERFPGAVCAAW